MCLSLTTKTSLKYKSEEKPKNGLLCNTATSNPFCVSVTRSIASVAAAGQRMPETSES